MSVGTITTVVIRDPRGTGQLLHVQPQHPKTDTPGTPGGAAARAATAPQETPGENLAKWPTKTSGPYVRSLRKGTAHNLCTNSTLTCLADHSVPDSWVLPTPARDRETPSSKNHLGINPTVQTLLQSRPPTPPPKSRA